MQPTGCILLLTKYSSEINNQANLVGIVFMDFRQIALFTVLRKYWHLYQEQLTS